MKKKYAFKIFVAFVFATVVNLWPLVTMAQDEPSPDMPEFPDFDPDNSVPIDGGAGILIATGIAYGVKKIYDKRKQLDENQKI